MLFGLRHNNTTSEATPLVPEEERVLIATSHAPQVSIVLPTFNESKNIPELLRLIHEAMTQADMTYECIFVDDSTDSTHTVIVEEAMRYEDRVGLIKRSGDDAKSGLTMAFRRGFEEARSEVIVCMDTDLQHPPAHIVTLVHTLRTRDVDVTVASRYALGGSAEGLDGVFRKIVSRSSNYFVWFHLPPTRKTTDPMTGFFAFKREVLNRVRFSSQGFKILVELLTGLDTPKVIDTPFTFLKRKEEKSKAKLIQGFIFYRDVLKLFFTSRGGNEALKYTFVALLGSLSYFVLLTYYPSLTTYMHVHVPFWYEEILLVIAVAFSSAFVFGWAFRDIAYTKRTFENIFLYASFILFTCGVHLYLLDRALFPTQYLLAVPATLFVSYLALYLLAKPLWKKAYQKMWSPERWFLIAFVLFSFTIANYFIDFSVWWYGLLLAMYVVVILQGLFALYLMVYTWEHNTHEEPEATEHSFLPPHVTFTAIIPCKHEKNTIADTLKTLHGMHYPQDMLQVLVVIHEGTDDGTIDVVMQSIETLGATNIELVTYNEDPVNKPHGLNVALKKATGDFVAIFDAEDEIHTNLCNVINTSLITNPVDVLQSGVQLMNFDSNWYSIFNVLEYYFWFKSSLHFYAKHTVMPLGGVSVFFRRTLLQEVGGWDETCLTEDAEIGIRLSQAGARMSVIYNAEYTTREETPPTLIGFIKQRTRWAQGFLQILTRGTFTYFPTLRQKLLAAYILAWPIIIPAVFLLFPLGIILMVSVSLPPALAVLSNMSLILFIAFTLTLAIGFHEFTREYQLRYRFSHILILIFLFYPYTLLLTIASMRAVYRNLVHISVWEKTEHINVHRKKDNLPLQESTPVTLATHK
jgi:cellulose synthase/poly-beta-1,6-N-acetylglucosamine synthase-like glycosyltransferase